MSKDKEQTKKETEVPELPLGHKRAIAPLNEAQRGYRVVASLGGSRRDFNDLDSECKKEIATLCTPTGELVSSSGFRAKYHAIIAKHAPPSAEDKKDA